MLHRIYVTYFILALMQGICGYLSVYAYADFTSSQLLAISSVMSSIIGGVLRLPIAKVLDLWGRAEGFLLMTSFTTLGLILYASCTSVSSYTAAAVIYYIGYDGMYYILTVWIADISRLKNRVLLLAVSQTPFICTSFTVPYAVNSFVSGKTNNWRWGYGTFAIVLPVAVAPLAAVFLWHQHKAAKQGLIKPRQSSRSLAQSFRHYFVEFDAVGCLILMAGLVLFLLPFNLASSVKDQWRNGGNIAMLVIGFLLLCCFPLWEKYGATKGYIPWYLLKDRTLFGCALAIGSLFVSYYCWDLYFYQFNQVVLGMTPTNAVYMGQIYNVGSCFFCCITGTLVKITKRCKWMAFVCVPIYCMGTALMIHFRQPGTHVGYVVMCQIFIAFAGGTINPCQEVAALAIGSQANFATVLAVLYLASSVGGAIGSSVSGGIWTNVYYSRLLHHLPASAQDVALTVYTDYTEALSYPVGSEIRLGIQRAFGDAQRDMCIAATAVTALTFIGVWLWRDIYLGNKKQAKGTVL